MSANITPTNWLINAGIIGLISVIEKNNPNIIDNLLFEDGSINKNILIDLIKNNFEQIEDSLPKPLNKLFSWHWNYLSQTFKWNYGSIERLVDSNLRRAENQTLRTSAKNQLQAKGFHYCDESVDFTSLNNTINETFSNTFGRNVTKTMEEAKREIFRAITAQANEYVYRKSIGYLFSKDCFYQNLFNIGWFGDAEKFLNIFSIQNILKDTETKRQCNFCSNSDFEVEQVTAEMMSFLFPVFSKFPNAYWNNNEQQVTNICSLCKFFLLHQHLALTRLTDYSELFISAPSFKVMYYLNKIAGELFGSIEKQEARDKRRILAMSVIEYSTKIKTTLGRWSGMNLEIVTKKGDVIDYFSLPYDVMKIITDRKIAALLSDIGEFKVLNMVLNSEYPKLINFGYRLMRESLSEKPNEKLINDSLFLWKNKQYGNLSNTSNKILKLYGLIEEKIKKEYLL